MSEETRRQTPRVILYILAMVCLVILTASAVIVFGNGSAQKEPVTPPTASDDDVANAVSGIGDQRLPSPTVDTVPEPGETAVVLSIGKVGPATVLPGKPITYMLAITNDGDAIATGVIITDTLPSGAHYVSGGTLMLPDSIGWTVDSLAPDDSAHVQFAVTATRTITNSDYRVSCAEGASAAGTRAVMTSAGYRVYQPLAQSGKASTYSHTYTYTYTIVNAYPHDPDAFTQGLVFEDGVLYEGTGLWGRSTLRKVTLETGEVIQSYDLPSEFFGEGITIYGDEIIQLTWRSHTGFVYERDSFDLLQEFTYPTEGWGITHDGERLIMSDGTSTLYFWDPETFEQVGQVGVYDENGPVRRLNELEYVQGKVFANVWQTDRIAIIAPQTGQVVGWIDLKGLLDPGSVSQPVDVLNGIAYDAETDRLFVTGKLWPTLFEIDLTVTH
jgi:uncharacterized repeat protein (TIGR01451 family)